MLVLLLVGFIVYSITDVEIVGINLRTTIFC